MTDLKPLIAWHEAEYQTYISARDNPYNSRDAVVTYKRCANNHAETARILSVLLRVREGCDIQEIESWEGDQQMLMIVGQFKSLRDLAELLGGGS